MEREKRKSRREFLKKAALGGAGIVLGTEFVKQISNLWSAKAEHGGATFNLHQMLTVAAVAAQIIPTGDTPGAREAGVVDYIDTKIKQSEGLQDIYKKGLQELDRASERKFGGHFIGLEQGQQKEVLKGVEKVSFFVQIRRDALEAFARSSIGQKVMGYPGGTQPHGHKDTTGAPQHSH